MIVFVLGSAALVLKETAPWLVCDWFVAAVVPNAPVLTVTAAPFASAVT